MNKIILERAIDQVKQILAPVDGICAVCYRNSAVIVPETRIEIMDVPTEIGIPVCRSCFDNILIAIGEIVQEY